MRGLMTGVFDMWSRYWNGSGYFWLIMFSCLLLLVAKKNNKSGRLLAGVQFLLLAVYFFPLTAWMIQKCVGELVYWRVMWLFPVVPLLAYTFVYMSGLCKKKLLKGLVSGCCILMIVFAGTSVWQAGNYVRVGNRQQIPDEVVKIASIIEENRTSKDSLVAVDDHIASYIRVYDPSIKMPYGREGRGALSDNARYLYRTIIIPDPPVKKLTQRAKKENCEFLVFQVQNEKSVKRMAERGYELLENVGSYGVFKKISE